MKDLTSTLQGNGKIQQFIVAVIVNLTSLSLGVHCGWLSPVITQLRSNQPPVGDVPFSEDQIGWICSVGPLGGFMIIPFCATIAERIGRKNFAILTGLPYIVSWFLAIFAQNYIHLFVARLVGGAAGSMTFFIVPLYIGEIAAENIRGFLGSLLLFALNIGILVGYVAGAYLPYHLFSCLCLISPIAFVVAMFFVPETPAYLVRRNRQLQAHKSLMFYRNNNRTLVEQELNELQTQAKTSDSSRKTVSLREFFGDRATRKGLIISIAIIVGQPFSGIAGITPYAETIFKMVGSSIPSEVAPIIIAAIQLVGSQMSTLMMERAGRRLLSLISCLGMAATLGIVALFFYLQRNQYDVSAITWLPLVGLSGFVITYNLGIGPVPFVIISEVFRLHVTSFATTLCFSCHAVVCFLAIKAFDLAMQILGFDGCFLMFTTICVVSFVCCYCLLPETKGRKREDIVDELSGIDKSRRDKNLDIEQNTANKIANNNTDPV